MAGGIAGKLVGKSDMSPKYQPILWRWLSWFKVHPVVWAFTAVVAVASWHYLPDGGSDWSNIYVAIRQWWVAPSEHAWPVLPWAAILLSPLGGASGRIATTLTNSLSVLLLAKLIRRFGGPEWMVVFVLLTPPGFWELTLGQIDVLVLSGLLFFNGLDPLIYLLKPQVAFGVLLPRLRRAGITYLLPLVGMVCISLVVWWGWPVSVWIHSRHLCDNCNASLWPYGIPLGAALLWFAWKTGDDRLGLAASPLLFPYVGLYSYLGLLAVVAARWPKWTIIVWVTVYLLFGVVFFGAPGVIATIAGHFPYVLR